MKYRKLVRDKIPEIINSSGALCKTHFANEEEYWEKLKDKLNEEVKEFLEEPSIGELADVQEVVNAIVDFKFDRNELEEARKCKAEKRGVFDKKIILDEADDK